MHKFGSAGSADGQFQLPVAIALDTKGLVYVAEWDNNRVQVLDQQGDSHCTHSLALFTALTPCCSFTLIKLMRVTVLSHSVLCHSDSVPPGPSLSDCSRRYTIVHMYALGGFIRFIGQKEKLQSPSGVAVSPNGHVYVSEWDKNRMSVFDPEGSFVEAIDCDRDNQFKGPFGIALGRGAANT